MEENSKKRSRKTKLVPRQYVDSDDENIAVMQQEIEQELTNIRAQSLLKKLSSSSCEPKPDLQFSVNVKVEECNEELSDEDIYLSHIDLFPENAEKETALDSTLDNPDDCIIVTSSTDKNKQDCSTESTATNTNKKDCSTEITATNKIKEPCIIETAATTSASDKEKENVPELSENLEKDKHDEVTQDINIQIESVRSLTQIENIEVTFYEITKNMIKEEFETFSKTTTSKADKLLEIHIRNYFGHYIPEVKLERTERKIQEVFNRWRTWVSCYPLIRDTPLMYICSSCELAWWHLHDFREHLKYHRRYVFDLYTEKHKSYIVIAGTKNELRYREIAIDSNCWKCGKDVKHHKEDYFECKGCHSHFETCILLSMHEGYCEGNRKYYKKCNKTYEEYQCLVCPCINRKVKSYVEFKCPVCPWKHWKEKEFFRHLREVHPVRSDLPIFFTPMKCRRCKLMVNNFNVHKCALDPTRESCGSCFKKFRSKLNLLVHDLASLNNYECRVCKKVLDKMCMEFEHLLEHTDKYKMLYICLSCQDSKCFLDLPSVKYHTTENHKDIEKANDNYCQVVVPKSLLEKLEPVKMMVQLAPAPEKKYEKPKVKMVDRACQSYWDELDIYTAEEETANVIEEDFESNIQITIINKNAVQKIMDDIPSEEIPEVIKNIKKENLEYNNGTVDEEANDVGNILIDSVTVDVAHIKDEPMDIDESNGINEINEINETNDTDFNDSNGNSDISVNDEINDNIMNSSINDVDFPIKLEIKEESDDSYEDENMLVINEDVPNSTLKEKRNTTKSPMGKETFAEMRERLKQESEKRAENLRKEKENDELRRQKEKEKQELDERKKLERRLKIQERIEAFRARKKKCPQKPKQSNKSKMLLQKRLVKPKSRYPLRRRKEQQ